MTNRIRTGTTAFTGRDANSYIMITMLVCSVHSRSDFILHSSFCILHSIGAPGRTRTDVYEFTKLALLLLKAQGLEMALPRGFAPRASCFANRCAFLLHLGSKLASVIGLAPIRVGLKGRLLELLCIHGHI